MVTLVERIGTLEPLVRPHVTTTPVIPFPEGTPGRVLMKCEHQQPTGSFKVRGAIAKLATLTAEQRRSGVVAATTGNHGLGVAYALQRLGGTGVIFVPSGASTVKVAAMEALGATVQQMGSDPGETERLARAYADENKLVYVSPYNDLDVIAGQGSIGVELDAQLPAAAPTTVVVAVGGGGLVSGVAAAMKARRPGVRVVAVSPANDAAMFVSARTGRAVHFDARPTLSDGTAGAVELGAITVPLCSALVDDWILVSEDGIRSALRTTLQATGQRVEGAAGVAVAGALMCATQAREGDNIAVISCGSNIADSVFERAVTADEARTSIAAAALPERH